MFQLSRQERDVAKNKKELDVLLQNCSVTEKVVSSLKESVINGDVTKQLSFGKKIKMLLLLCLLTLITKMVSVDA